MMLNDGVTAGEDGWSTQVAREGRRWDYANETEQKAVEVKSGTTPVQEGSSSSTRTSRRSGTAGTSRGTSRRSCRLR